MSANDLALDRARRQAVTALGDLNPFHLSRRAECGDPVSRESEGAMMLGRVRDGVVELLEQLDVEALRRIAEDQTDIAWLENDGAVYEIADAAPSVYTHTRWLKFVDLAAYQDDTDDLLTGDLTEIAGITLVRLAERLAWTLLYEAAETIDGAA